MLPAAASGNLVPLLGNERLCRRPIDCRPREVVAVVDLVGQHVEIP